MIKNLSIITDNHRCDYCWEDDRKLISMDAHDRDTSIDICFDCVLEIYNFAKKEIL